MSTLKVNTIQDTTGNDALTIDSSGNVTASQGFVPSTQLSHRNLIINGDFQVSQRGDYTSATALPTSATYYLDRFRCRRNGVTGTFTHKSNQTLDNNDVVNTLRLDVTSTATGRVEISSIFEDFNWFKNKTITFSAQVKSNSTDARLVFNADGGGGTTASTAHTGGGSWELLTGTATLTSGVTGVQIYAGIQASGTGDVAGVTSGDYFEISEIQVEVGSVATPFEHRSYGEELARCQRYYTKLSAASDSLTCLGNALITSSSAAFINSKLPTTMRTKPSISQMSISIEDMSGRKAVSSLSTNRSTPDSIVLDVSCAAGLTVGRYGIVQANASTAAYLSADAEL